MKKEYTDLQADGKSFKYGYDRFALDAKEPYLYFESADNPNSEITLEISPHQLRKLAMRLIKLSYRVDIKQ